MNAHLPVVRPLLCYARRGATPMHQKRVPNHRHLHVYLLMAKKMATLGHPSTLQIPLVAKTCTMSRTSLQSAGIMAEFNIWCIGKGTARLTTPGNL